MVSCWLVAIIFDSLNAARKIFGHVSLQIDNISLGYLIKVDKVATSPMHQVPAAVLDPIVHVVSGAHARDVLLAIRMMATPTMK